MPTQIQRDLVDDTIDIVDIAKGSFVVDVFPSVDICEQISRRARDPFPFHRHKLWIIKKRDPASNVSDLHNDSQLS